MSARAEEIYCTVCDHGVVDGVACDGMPEECPLNAVHLRTFGKERSRLSSVRAVDCAQPDERDFVRSED
jgi:hypothetical protein